MNTAFLHGMERDDVDHSSIDILCEPVNRLNERIGLGHLPVGRLLQCVPGLVDALRAWWLRGRSELARIGWERE